MQVKIHYQAEVPNEAIWKLNDHGNFTIASSWEYIRRKKEKSQLNSFIWNRKIPFKGSFLLWRALRQKLPTNDKLNSFGVDPIECICCVRPGVDDIHHIFVAGNFANHI